MNKERFSFLCSLYFPFFPPPSYLFVVIHKLLPMRDPEGSLLINLSFAMCAPPKKAMKVRYREHELIWGGLSGFILIDSEKIEVFFFNFHLCPRDNITLILKRGSNQSAVAGVPKKWENELNKSHFESFAIFHGQEYSTLSLDVFKPVENNIKFTVRAVYKLDDPWRENMCLDRSP